MSAKTSADVLIGGKIYTLSGYESEDYLQRVANYINSKINEFDEMEQFRRLPGEMKSTLVELNIADDYFKAKEQAEKLDQDVKEKEKELYEVKHELISLRIKAESSEKEASELSKENRKLLLHKSKLETALEEALLGKVKGQAVPEPQTGAAQNTAGKQHHSRKDASERQGKADGNMPDSPNNLNRSASEGQNGAHGNAERKQNGSDKNAERKQNGSDKNAERKQNGSDRNAERKQSDSDHITAENPDAAEQLLAGTE